MKFKLSIKQLLMCALMGLFVWWIPATAQQPTVLKPVHSAEFKHQPVKPHPAISDSARQRSSGKKSVTAPANFDPELLQSVNDSINGKNKTLVFLDKTDVMSFDQERLPDIQLLRGNVVLRHDAAYLYCDSAYFNQVENSFTAYSNVRMVQGDTLFVYGDTLYYDGNTKMARLRNNVRMKNRDVVLTTDSLNYDRLENVGYYFGGGKITDEENVLTSDFGYYYPGLRTAVFNKHVVGKNESMNLHSDTLRYNTDTKVASILGPTTIVHNDENTVYSEYGWYNMDTEVSELLKNSSVVHKDGKELRGDTIYYDKKSGIGKSFSNVVLLDTVNKIILTGDYGYYEDQNDLGLVTDHALMREFASGDTLYLSADTLFAYADSLYKTIEAYHKVRFYRSDIQGVADSIFFNSRDSVLHLLTNPIVWSDNQQLTGDTIRIYSKDGGVDRLHVINNAFASQQEDSIRFNQLSGKEFLGYVRDQKLYKVDILGNAESIFFPKDNEELIGMNKTESSFLVIYFNDGKVYRIVAKPAPKAVTYPIDMVREEGMYLRNFSWYDYLRPMKWEDVFLKPELNKESKVEQMFQMQRDKEKAERKALRKEREKDIDDGEE